METGMKNTTKDWAQAQFIDSFSTTELAFPQASVIGLLLFDSTAELGTPGHRALPFRYRLSSQRARALAAALIASADILDGTGQPRQ
jgi:hypothetical protein